MVVLVVVLGTCVVEVDVTVVLLRSSVKTFVCAAVVAATVYRVSVNVRVLVAA